MALIIETGAGVSNADSYGTLAACRSYIDSYYPHDPTHPDADLEAALRRSYNYINSLKFKGARTHGRAQTGALPRTGLTDCEGLAVGTTEIPADVIQAQFELAHIEIQTPGVLSPQSSLLDTVVSREKVDGAVEIAYDTSRISANQFNLQPIVSAAMRKLECYLINGGNQGLRQTAIAVV